MMVRFFSAMGREVRGMHQAAYVLAAFALGSQVLALLRDRLLAASFGAGHTLDVYYAAFRIPDFLFATVASLLSLYALLPVLSRLQLEHPDLVISFLRRMLLVFFVSMGVISSILFILAPRLVPLVAPGIASAQLVMLTRILLLQPILLGASNVVASLTQLRHRFILYSVSPLLYNLGIIFGIVFLYPVWGLAGLGWGVVFGALMHLSIQLPYFSTSAAVRPLPFGETMRDLKEILTLSIPRTLALAATQISLLVLVALASFLSPGSISIFMFAYNLQAVPLTIIGISYSIAAFPTLARFYAAGKKEEFVQHIETALRHILFWCIPATVFGIVLRAQLVRAILGAGLFNWSATRLTAAALALFLLSLAAQSLTFLIARAYYAAGNTRKPLYYGFADIFVSVASALALVYFFHTNLFFRDFVGSLLRVDDIAGATVLMLALGYTLGATAEFCISIVFFVRDFRIPLRHVSRLVFQSFAASVIGAAVAYLVLSVLGVTLNIETTLGIVLQGGIAGAAGLAVSTVVLVLMRNEEVFEAWGTFRRRFISLPSVAIEPTDVSS